MSKANEAQVGGARVKRGMAEMLKGGVIMDVVNVEQQEAYFKACQITSLPVSSNLFSTFATTDFAFLATISQFSSSVEAVIFTDLLMYFFRLDT